MAIQHSIIAVMALGLSQLVSTITPGHADETFVCPDGSSVTIDGDNREAMQDHPCVKAWFADDLARRNARAEPGAGSAPGAQPVLHTTTLNRAAAARDLRQRPAYLAWSRSRNGQVRTLPRNTGTLVRASPLSRPLGVTIVAPTGKR